MDVLKEYLRRLWKLWSARINFVLDGLGLIALVVSFFSPSFSFPWWVFWIFGGLIIITFGYANVSLFANQESEKQRLQSCITELESSLATEKKSIAAALAMLTGEIDQNLEELTSLWERVKEVDEFSRESPLVFARRFTDLGPPTLSSTVWEKQYHLLTEALCDEQLRQVQSFYNQLTKIIGIHTTLRNLRDEQKSLQANPLPKGSFWSVLGPPRPFDKNVPVFWDDLEQTTLWLIKDGSPLRDKTRQSAA